MKRMRVIHSWPWYWLVWPWWGGRMYRIVTGVTSDVGVPSTYLVLTAFEVNLYSVLAQANLRCEKIMQRKPHNEVNSQATEWSGYDYDYVVFKHILEMMAWAFTMILLGEHPMVVFIVMAWCHLASNHYLNQCWKCCRTLQWRHNDHSGVSNH